RLLVVTKIFPNRQKPDGATYNRHQFRELNRVADVEVMAVIPWFPGRERLGGAPAVDVPERDVIDGLTVTHPRALYGPSFTRPLSGMLYTASLLPHVSARRGDFDVVLGCFGYPDGWAATALGRALGVPSVIKVHGSDVNVLGEDPLVAPGLRSAFSRAAAVVGPSRPLVERAVELGADPVHSCMIPNGTDRDDFHPRDRATCRAALGEGEDDRPWILFVGRLSQAKGAVDLLDAFRRVHAARPSARLVFVGDGVDGDALRAAATSENLPVLFAGFRHPDEIPIWIGACDLLSLPSHAEGTPNVVLEALASGRRVVASDVGGIPDVMTDSAHGRMVPARDVDGLAQALVEVLDHPAEPEALSRLAPVIPWRDSALRLHNVLEGAVARARRRSRQRAPVLVQRPTLDT
ncbi:MAG: glycosyltransferase family 4 protein, partial [Polyangiaceae bacterium]